MNTGFDLTYVTIDSVSEGVGSSQILPLLKRLSRKGLSINLISFEKNLPGHDLELAIKDSGVYWNHRAFEGRGAFGSLSRILDMSKEIPETRIIHARSDIPALAAALSRKAPILWDVRSLWADQKAFIEENQLKKTILNSYRVLENIASFNASAMSTLTNSIVPILEKRHRSLPKLRTVVPTAVDLEHFKFNPIMPSKIRGLYSVTYNNYYDLTLSERFVKSLLGLQPMEIHWARPNESPKSELKAGETKIFATTQREMSSIVPGYSFGISICRNDAGPSLKAAMPTKVAEFLSCGRPVIVNAGLGDLDDYLSEFDAGVILDGTASDLEIQAQKLLSLLADPETPQRCRALAEKYFDMDKGAEKYLDIYRKVWEQSASN